MADEFDSPQNVEAGVKKTSRRKGTKRKRAKVTVPKMTNIYRPEGMSLEDWQVALRVQAAEKENFVISPADEKYCPGEYAVMNPLTRNSYKVVFRGKDSKWNYCSCPDFRTSGLGTCKHLEAVGLWTRKKRRKIYRDAPAYSSVYVDYKGGRRVGIRIGENSRDALERLSKNYFDKDGYLLDEAFGRFDAFLMAAEALEPSFRCYDDALKLVLDRRDRVSREQMLLDRYSDDALDRLLTSKLYLYQKEGVRFAVRAGKAIIADEMGLGKTVQAIAAAEIYLRERMAGSVLIVCPTTLKYQWKKEIEHFTGSDTVEAEDDYVEDGRIRPKVVVVEGNPARRWELYNARAPYKIVSYHAMTNDIREHGRLVTDVLIMDEIQRLKNWNTLISKAARKIDSQWSVLLSGTPLENKLEELYANMELVDQFCLGPYYLFRDEHILLDPVKGSTVGYKNLNSIGERISDRLIRRTKSGVKLQLPKRSDQYVLVPMTDVQTSMHAEFKWDLTMLLHKYEKFHFMTEQDRRRMMLLLSEMRMVADSTFILEPDLKTRSDLKIEEVMNILQNIFDGGNEKVVIFSEWERMTRLVAMELDKRGVRFEYLNGRVPAKERGMMVENFRTIPESRVFISTDAGSTGLNLQVATTLINMDLPWNPAVLEQRVARIYRLGQENPVQIINLVSKDSIEEGMIGKLRFKTSMFEGVLDGGADTVFISEDKFKHFMEDIQNVMKETPVVGYVEEDAENEAANPESEFEAPADGASESIIREDDTPSRQPESPVQTADAGKADSTSGTAAAAGGRKDTAGPEEDVRKPQDLISQGISFFSGLAGTLKSPEATRSLVDSIVEVDEKTGRANIKIPVSGKDSVLEVLSLFGKLIQK